MNLTVTQQHIQAGLFEALVRDEHLEWEDKALCATVGGDAWYPEKGESTFDAKKICRLCEVRLECLQAALDRDERFGVWGGLSERERRKLKNKSPNAAILASRFRGDASA